MFVLIAGASGSGKSTIISEVINHFKGKIALLPSSTSRPIRPGEVEGGSYFYLTQDEFKKCADAGEFIEFKQVHANGYYYGVHKKRFEEYSKKYPMLIKDVDVLGIADIVKQGFDCVTIFIDIPDNEALKKRLELRGDSPEEIKLRLERKAFEDAFKGDYNYVVRNINLPEAVNDVIKIVKKEAKKRKIV